MQSNAGSELLAFGVTHATGEWRTWREGTYKANRNASTVLKLVCRAGNPSRVGIEYLHDELNYNPFDTGSRFWKALFLMAKRKNIELVPLEGTRSARALVDFQNHLLIAEDLPLPNRYLKAWRDKYSHDKTLHERAVYRVFEEFFVHFPKPTMKQIRKLINAMAVFRSIRMSARARQGGLKHVIVGTWHAEDLRKLEGAEAALVQQRRRFKAIRSWLLLRKRLRDYSKLKSVVESLEKAAG